MRIIVVDDEELAVENLLGLLRQVEPTAEIMGFSEPDEAFAYLEESGADIAFLDIEIGAYSGLDLAERCKDLCSNVNIIFVTGYMQYTIDAFRLHASGYLMKPVRIDDLRAEIDNLRYPLDSRVVGRIRVQTFGCFEIFVEGQLLKFTRAKCKECLAYLIDRRGARITYPELSAILWEDKPYDRAVQNHTQKVVSDLVKTLKNARIEDLIIKSRQDIAVDTTLLDCDYYAALSGDQAQIAAFTGEYMSNYSWAEITLGKIVKNGWT